MNYIFEPIKQFKFKSNFVKILLAMITLCVVLSTLFVYYIAHIISEKTLEYSAQTAQSYSDIILDNTDNYIISLHQSLTQLSYSRNVFQTALAKEVKDLNNNLVTSELALTTNNNLLIQKAVMYIPKQNNVLTSSYKAYTLEDSPYSAMITDYEQQTVLAKTIEDSNKMSSAFLYGSNLILARDFPLNGAKKLATLFYFVDMDELFRRTTQEVSGNGSILVYDSFQAPVFSSKTNYPQEITPKLLADFPVSGNGYYSLNGSAYFISSSGITNWKILYKLDELSLSPSDQAIFLSLAPIVLIVTVIACIFSFFLTAVIYAPIQKLFSSIQMPKDLSDRNDTVYKNEFDLISHSFHQLSDRQTELDAIISNVSDSIMSKLFMDLLKGTQFESSEVEKILKESKSPFRLNSFYVVCVLSLHDGQDISGLSPSLIGELCELISDYCTKHDSIYHMAAMDHNRLAVIFAFNKDDSVIKLLKGLTDLEPFIRSFSKKHGLPFCLNAGHMYTSILDIGFSYQEALSALEETKKPAAAADSVQAPSEDKPGIIPSRVKQILDLVKKDDLGSAVKLSNRTIDEISKSGGVVIENYKLYINLIQNGISKIDYINFSAFSNDLLLPQINTSDDTDEEALKVSMMDSCETILQQLGRILKRKNNPYIISSQNYIHDHYQDYDLSQNTVAEAIGVKSTYLSKLFKESLGVNFTDYLNQYRIQKSLALLTDTTETLNEVALHSGYNSVQNYIRVFKKYMNMTPGQYRKEESKKSLFE